MSFLVLLSMITSLFPHGLQGGLPGWNTGPLDFNNLLHDLNGLLFTPESNTPSILDLISRHGCEGEHYPVVTKDDYILRLTRIKAHKPSHSVIIYTGPLTSAEVWVGFDPKFSLPHALVTSGYETFICESRGSPNSRGHVKHPISMKEYWDFSLDEMATRDLPACIEKVLEFCDHGNLYLTSYSTGATVFLAMASALNSTFTKKVKAAALMAPVLNVDPALESSQYYQFFKTILPYAVTYFGALDYEVFPRSDTKVAIIQNICRHPHMASICLSTIGHATGVNATNIDKKNIGYYLSTTPSSTSLKAFKHLYQIYFSDDFERYNHGSKGNTAKYEQNEPPSYDLSKVTIPIGLFAAPNDKIVTVSSMRKLAASLPNVKTRYLVPEKKFGHMEFQIGYSAHATVYPKIIEFFKKFK